MQVNIRSKGRLVAVVLGLVVSAVNAGSDRPLWPSQTHRSGTNWLGAGRLVVVAQSCDQCGALQSCLRQCPGKGVGEKERCQAQCQTLYPCPDTCQH